VLKDIAGQHEHWVTARAKDWGAPIVEPARLLIAIGKEDRWQITRDSLR
jgi:hypothetical protein